MKSSIMTDFFVPVDGTLSLSSLTAGKLPKYHSRTRIVAFLFLDIIKGSVTLHYQPSERTVKA